MLFTHYICYHRDDKIDIKKVVQSVGYRHLYVHAVNVSGLYRLHIAIRH